MATSKKTEDKILAAIADEAAPAVVVERAPNNSARPNDLPIVKATKEHTNSTFAARAKVFGGNKRVAESESK